MKKLFKAIRQYDLEQVKAIISKTPDAIYSIATPPPKKDIGQSPLQVAIKISAFDIAEYLIEQGADVNFMEDETAGTTLRCPLLHDAIGHVMFCLCCSPLNTQDEINLHINNAGTAFSIMKLLCERGADVNKEASNGRNALDKCVLEAEKILDKQKAYPFTQKEAEEYFVNMLDILIKHGSDFIKWANGNHYPNDFNPNRTNRVLFIDDFIPQKDVIENFTIRGKAYSSVRKGDVDLTAHTRSVIQKYIKDRNIQV